MFKATNWMEFLREFTNAHEFELVAANCSRPNELDTLGAIPYLTNDGLSGFAVRKSTGELFAVFNLVKGRGTELMTEAKKAGATRLDCFDGFLPTFYKSHGFTEYKREDNWTEGEADIIYMSTEV